MDSLAKGENLGLKRRWNKPNQYLARNEDENIDETILKTLLEFSENYFPVAGNEFEKRIFVTRIARNRVKVFD